MGDFFAWFILIFWSLWGMIHFAMRKGLLSDFEGKKYEIPNSTKRNVVLFVEGPVVGSFAIVWHILKGVYSLFKILVVTPTKALDKWAQDDEMDTS